MKFSHKHGFIDRESYVAQYLALALFTVGVVSTIGSDDLLAAFAAGKLVATSLNFGFLMSASRFRHLLGWPLQHPNRERSLLVRDRPCSQLWVLRLYRCLVTVHFFQHSGARDHSMASHYPLFRCVGAASHSCTSPTVQMGSRDRWLERGFVLRSFWACKSSSLVCLPNLISISLT